MSFGAYSLHAVLALRERAVCEARRLLAAALARERAALSAHGSAQAALDAIRGRLVERGAEGAEGVARRLQLEDGLRERLRRDAARAACVLALAGEALGRASAEVAARRMELVATDRDREAIARHRAAWTRRRAEARARAEDAAHEEASGCRGLR